MKKCRKWEKSIFPPHVSGIFPALLGEVDILKAIQLLPGVRNAGEGNAGFYVRGGGPDQNLIILDDAVVYNTGHLFGFFSIFNSDAIKNTTLIKGGILPQYGGRLSSSARCFHEGRQHQRLPGRRRHRRHRITFIHTGGPFRKRKLPSSFPPAELISTYWQNHLLKNQVISTARDIFFTTSTQK